jgi:hypothetical protein
MLINILQFINSVFCTFAAPLSVGCNRMEDEPPDLGRNPHSMRPHGLLAAALHAQHQQAHTGQDGQRYRALRSGPAVNHGMLQRRSALHQKNKKKRGAQTCLLFIYIFFKKRGTLKPRQEKLAPWEIRKLIIGCVVSLSAASNSG